MCMIRRTSVAHHNVYVRAVAADGVVTSVAMLVLLRDPFSLLFLLLLCCCCDSVLYRSWCCLPLLPLPPFVFALLL